MFKVNKINLFLINVMVFVLLMCCYSQSAIAASTSKPGAFQVSVQPTYLSGENVVISWSSSNRASQYRLFIIKDAEYVYDRTFNSSFSQNVGPLAGAGNYRVQMIASNLSGETYSNVAYFSIVDSTPTLLRFPVDGTGWTGIIYGGLIQNKYGHIGIDYRAVDLNLNVPNFNADQGKAVWAIADGTVYYIDPNYGQITIKHNIPLFLKDGSRVYHTWYSNYAHMANIIVKKGDAVTPNTILGNVSHVSKDTIPDHLHFSMYINQVGNAWDTRNNVYTLSPLWIAGYDSNCSYGPYSGDSEDAQAYARLTALTSDAPPSN